MKTAIIDYRASDAYDALLNFGFNVIKTPKINNVYNAISGHPDIIIHKINDETTICEPRYVGYFKESIINAEIIPGNRLIDEKYPLDIAYNAACVGKSVFCLEKYTDKRILEYYKENGYKIINTKQGYAKCSICIISENAIITSDKNISIAAEKNNIEVLLVDDKNVKLEDFEHGFIGGASGLNENKLFINGNIEKHNSCNAIVDFCNNHNVEIISLHKSDIEDIGSIIFI